MSKLTKSSLLLLLLVSCADAQAEQGDFLDRIKNFFGLSQEEADQNKDENPALEESGYPIGGEVTSSTKISEGGHLDGYWRGGRTEDKSSFHQDQPFAEEPVEGSSVAPGQYPQSNLSIAPEMIPRTETPPLPEVPQSIQPAVPPSLMPEESP